jgi:hypothetical protein
MIEDYPDDPRGSKQAAQLSSQLLNSLDILGNLQGHEEGMGLLEVHRNRLTALFFSRSLLADKFS